MISKRAACLSLAAMIGACSGSEAKPSDPGGPGAVRSDLSRATPTASAEESEALRQGSLQATLRMHRSLANTTQNSVLAPISVQTAVGMLRPGADGETAAALDRMMGWTLPEARTLDALNALDAALETRNSEKIELHSANRIFLQEGDASISPIYLDSIALHFGAGISLLDFVAAPEEARLQINGWVSTQTRDHIPDLLPEGTIDRGTALVLTNAVYLEAEWQTVFDEQATRDQPFQRGDGSTISVPTMNGVIGGSYASGDGWIAAELPYAGRDLAMLVVRPEGGLASFEGALDGPGLDAITDALTESELAVSIPRFDFQTTESLLPYFLEASGVRALDNLSRLAPERDLEVTAIVHAATIAVDEDGTVATGATAIVVGETSAPVTEPVRLDRPFFFAIRDRSTGAILFIGHVADPSSSSAS